MNYVTIRRILPSLLVGVFAFTVSVISIGTPSLWGDEVATSISASRSLPDLFAVLSHIDAVHGAYYLFMHGWIHLFGASPTALRIPSAMAVGFAAAGVVELVRRFDRMWPAILAGSIFGILPKVHDFGGDARSYAVTLALTAWILVFVVDAVRAHSVRRWVVVGALLTIAIVWFVYAALVGVAVLMWVWWMHRGSLRAAIVTFVVSAVLASPLVLIAFSQREQIAWIAAAGVNGPREILAEAWFGWPRIAVVGWALLIAAIIAAWRGSANRRLVALAAILSLGPLVLLWSASPFAPLLSPRYLVIGLPGVAVLLSVTVTLLWRWRWWTGVVALLLVVALTVPLLVTQRGPFAKHDFDLGAVAAVIAAEAQPGDAVLFDESGAKFRGPRLALRAYPSAFEGLVDVRGLGLSTATVWGANVRPLTPRSLDGSTRVWLIELKGRPDQTTRAVLAAEGFTAGATQRLHTSQVTGYTRVIK